MQLGQPGLQGGTRKIEVARELGADLAVDYLRPGWAGDVRAATGGVDVALERVGGTVARAAFELLEPGGRILSFGLASGRWAEISEDEAAARGVTLVRTATCTSQRSPWG